MGNRVAAAQPVNADLDVLTLLLTSSFFESAWGLPHFCSTATVISVLQGINHSDLTLIT